MPTNPPYHRWTGLAHGFLDGNDAVYQSCECGAVRLWTRVTARVGEEMRLIWISEPIDAGRPGCVRGWLGGDD